MSKTIEFAKRDGARTSVTLDPATLATIPAEVVNLRGWANTSVVAFGQHLYPGMMSLKFGDIIVEIAEQLNTSPSAVVRAACAWQAGSHSAERRKD